MTVPSNASSFHKLFSTQQVALGSSAESQLEVLAELTDLAVKSGGVAEERRASVLKALKSREAIGSTGIGLGIAIPHVKINDVEGTVTAVCVTHNKIDFRAVDGEPCDIFILLLSPKNQAEKHLEVLRWLSSLVRNPDFCRFLRASKTAKEAVGLFKEMSE